MSSRCAWSPAGKIKKKIIFTTLLWAGPAQNPSFKAVNRLSIKENLMKIDFWFSKIFTSKWVRSWNQKKIKNTFCLMLPEKKFAPQFRYFLNVWNIINLEYTFLIWAGNCFVKFWRSPKNFKFQNSNFYFGKLLI